MQVYFTSQTRAKVTQLKNQLKNSKKSGSMNDYLLNIKTTVDTLASVESPIDESEHIQIILDGLSDEYDSVVTCIISRTNAYTIPEIETLLMTMKEGIEKHKAGSSDAFSMQPLQANLAQNSNKYNNQFDRGSNKAPSYSSNRGRYNNGGDNYRGSNRGKGRFSRGGGRNSSNQYNKPQCQLCDKYGYTALNCWHKYDTKNQESSNSNNYHQQGRAMIAETTNEDASAFMAVPKTLFDPSWYPNSGATNHLTPKDANLMGKVAYSGD